MLKRRFKYLSTISVLIFCFSFNDLLAYPSGIFVNGGRTSHVDVLNHPFVDGVLIRFRWNSFEPEDDQFDFSFLRSEIDKVSKAGKKFSFALITGPSSPDWLYKKGCQRFDFSMNHPHSERRRNVVQSIPVPWDDCYLVEWFEAVSKVGEFLKDYDNLVLVHATISSQNGFEMQLPYKRSNNHRKAGMDLNGVDIADRKYDQPFDDWYQKGFSEVRYRQAFFKNLSVFMEVFNGVHIDVELHPIFNETKIASDIVSVFLDDRDRFGKVGVFGAWLNNRDLKWDRPLFEIFRRYSEEGFCSFQMIGNETKQVRRLGSDGLEGAFNKGFASGCRYFEIWEADIRNKKLEAKIEKFHKLLKD